MHKGGSAEQLFSKLRLNNKRAQQKQWKHQKQQAQASEVQQAYMSTHAK